jgi:hypothetical protein
MVTKEDEVIGKERQTNKIGWQSKKSKEGYKLGSNSPLLIENL